MPAIFISYRRSDSEGEAGRLSDLLTSRFSGQSVFMDVDSIKPGRDFRRAIEESIQECSIQLAIIGPGWLTAATPAGTRRLDAPNDYVRLEIAAALQRDIPVIPVLVRGAHMPQPEQLPQELRELAYRNSVELTHARWKSDLQVLIDALEPLLHRSAPTPKPTAPAPATYLHASTPAPLHSLAPAQPISPRPGPSARRSAYTAPLPRSPFADTPTTINRYPVRPIAPITPAHRTISPAPSHVPPHVQPPVPAPAPGEMRSQVHPQMQPQARPPAAPPLQSVRQPEPEPTSPAAIPFQEAAVDRVRRELAHFIGPIAEIVVRRAIKRATSEGDLCAIVSQEIESASDRAKFLTHCKGKS